MNTYFLAIACLLTATLLLEFWIRPKEREFNLLNEVTGAETVKHPLNCKCEICTYIREITRGKL